jgi:hypothetical protein
MPFNSEGNNGSCGADPLNILCLAFDGEIEPFQKTCK